MVTKQSYTIRCSQSASPSNTCYNMQVSFSLLLSILIGTVTSKAISDIMSESPECQTSYHILINTLVPICKDDWNILELMMMDRHPREISRQICTTYCLYPLKIAGEMCPDIWDIYEFIVGLCSQNERQESCLSTFLQLNQTFPPAVCPNTIAYNTCPMECTTQLNTTLHTVGCCFTALNNTVYGANITGPFEYTYWNQCGVPIPSACEFDYRTALSRANSILSNNVQILYYYSLVYILAITIINDVL